MKKIKGLIIGLICVLIISVLGLLFSNTAFNHRSFSFNFNFGDRETSLIHNESFNVSEIQSLFIDVRSLDVTFVKGTGDEIIVNHYNHDDATPLTISKSNGTLKIEQGNDVSVNFFNWGSWDARLEIQLPEKQYQDITIRTVSGEIKVPTLSAQSITLRTTSGDFNLTNLTSETLQIDSTSGDLNMINVEATTKIGTVSGDLDITQIKGSVDISTTSGDVDLEGFTMLRDSTISTVSGEVEIAFTRESSAFTLDASSVSGDLENHFTPASQDNPVNLRIRTTSGDIELQ